MFRWNLFSSFFWLLGTRGSAGWFLGLRRLNLLISFSNGSLMRWLFRSVLCRTSLLWGDRCFRCCNCCYVLSGWFLWFWSSRAATSRTLLLLICGTESFTFQHFILAFNHFLESLVIDRRFAVLLQFLLELLARFYKFSLPIIELFLNQL